MELSRLFKWVGLYAGVALVGDKLLRPSIISKKARLTAGKLDLPVLNIGHRLTSSAMRQLFKAPALWGDVNVDTDARFAEEDGRLVYASPTELPFEDNTFGAVILLHIIEDSEAPLEIAKEAERVVAPGGMIYAVTPPWWTPHAWWRKKWLLVDLPSGRKQALRLWRREKPPTLSETFTEEESA